jgi:cytochrome c biogenesis factor
MLEILGRKWINGIIAGCILILAILFIKPYGDIYTNLSISVLAFGGIATIYRLYKSIGSKGVRNNLISCASHIVHFGILVMLAGVLMSTYSTSESVIFMKFYEKKSVGGYEIQLIDLAYPVEHKLATAVLTKIGTYNIYKDSAMVASGEARFREINGEFITEPFIYRGLFSDVNVRYQGIGTRDQIFISVANIRVIPGMTIIWAGSILIVIGIIPLLFKKKLAIHNDTSDRPIWF